MNGLKLLCFLSSVALVACTESIEIDQYIQNEVKKFSFIKMQLDEEIIDENLSFYSEGPLHAVMKPGQGTIVRRCSYVKSDEWENPCSDCSGDLNMFYIAIRNNYQE